MKYSVYPTYEITKKPWISRIPEHWKTRPLKYDCRITTGYAFKSDSFSDTGIPLLRIGDISPDGSVDLSNCKYMETVYLRSHKQYLVKKGDIVMAMTGATIGKVGQFPHSNPALLNQRVCIFRGKTSTYHKFLWFILQTSIYKNHIEINAFGGAQPNISDTDLLKPSFPIPSPSEQQLISDFLIRETSKIDTFISKQHKLIGLLKEKKQAVISHAVTKGLNIDSPMKDSRVEFLNDIPEHWKKTALKRMVTQPIIDGPHESPIKHDHGIPFISAESLSRGVLNFDKKWGYISPNDHLRFSKRYRPHKGDILVVKLGATTGTVAIVDIDDEFNIWVPLAAIRVDHSKLLPKYLLYVLRSEFIQNTFKVSWTYGTQETLGLGTLSNIQIPIPPLGEQQDIISYIEERVPDIETTIDKSNRCIELLLERRTALISAAVTGEIDVTGVN